MRSIAVVLVVLALACEAFAYWGLSTTSGRRTFDEMAGIVPVAAAAAGALFAACAAIAWWRSRRTRGQSQ